MPIEEQKFGLEGVERDQGFEPMPIAHPVDVPEPDHMSEHELSHFRRPEPAQPEIREYRDVNTGKEIPANQTVSAEQGASDLHSARAQERAAREQLAQDDLKFALDQLPSQEGGPQPAQQSPEAPQPELDGIQPEQTDPTQTQDPWAEADKQIGEMLKDPVVRERIEAEYSHVVRQANAVAEQAKQQAAAVINNLAQEANLVASALFPELAGVEPRTGSGRVACHEAGAHCAGPGVREQNSGHCERGAATSLRPAAGRTTAGRDSATAGGGSIPALRTG